MTVTSRQQIGEWFDAGVKHGAGHMLVVCDEFSYEDYPVYVADTAPDEERDPYGSVYAMSVDDAILHYSSGMQTVHEVSDLTADKAVQLAGQHTWSVPTKPTAEPGEKAEAAGRYGPSPKKPDLIDDLGELIYALQVPISISSAAGTRLLAQVGPVFDRLHVRLIGFGYGSPEQYAEALRKELGHMFIAVAG